MNTAAPTCLRPDPEHTVRCEVCSTTLAIIRDGALIIRQKHHGEIHITRLTLAQILNLLQERAA